MLLWKGIICQKVSGATVKHAEQKTVKWQENTVSSADMQWWKQQPKLTLFLHKNSHLYEFKDRMECQFSATSLLSVYLHEVLIAEFAVFKTTTLSLCANQMCSSHRFIRIVLGTGCSILNAVE
jgi:hypothetical protein